MAEKKESDEAKEYKEEQLEFPPISLSDMNIIESIANIENIGSVFINENLQVVQATTAEAFVRNIGLGPMDEKVTRVFSNWMDLVTRLKMRSLNLAQLKKLMGADQKFRSLLEHIEPFLTEEQKNNFDEILSQIDAALQMLSMRAEVDEEYQEYLKEQAKEQALRHQIRMHQGYHGDVRLDLRGYPPGVYHIFTSKDDERTFYLRYLLLRDRIYNEQTIYIRVTPIGISARGVTEANRPLGEGGYWNFGDLMKQLIELGQLTFAAGSDEALAAREETRRLRAELEALPTFVPWGQSPPLFPKEGYRILEGDPGALIERLEIEYTTLDKYGRLSMKRDPLAITPEGYFIWDKGPIPNIDAFIDVLVQGVAERCGSDKGKIEGEEAAMRYMKVQFGRRWTVASKQPAAALLQQTKISLEQLLRNRGRLPEAARRWMDFDNMVEKVMDAFKAPSARLHPFSMTPNLAGKDRDNTIVPYNYNRVGAYESTDYINASYVSLNDRSYIVAQAPLKRTLKDFWEMIQREKIEYIVNLSPLKDGEEDAGFDYYSADACPLNITPDIFVQHEGEEELAAVGVTRHDELIKERVVKRQLHLLEGTKTLARVTQYHYDNWPKDDTPEVDLLTTLLDAIQTDKRLLVHSSRGAGRAGTFVAIHSIINGIIAPQLEAKKGLEEILVNPEETLLKLLMQRTAPVANIAQLSFIYRALAEFAGRS